MGRYYKMNLKNKKNDYEEALNYLDDSIELFRIHDTEMQAQTMRCFLRVALAPKEGVSMQQIIEDLDIAQSTLSRNIAMLSKFNRHKVSGHGFVESFEDPMERRRKLVKLTSKGQKVANGLARGYHAY